MALRTFLLGSALVVLSCRPAEEPETQQPVVIAVVSHEASEDRVASLQFVGDTLIEFAPEYSTPATPDEELVGVVVNQEQVAGVIRSSADGGSHDVLFADTTTFHADGPLESFAFGRVGIAISVEAGSLFVQTKLAGGKRTEATLPTDGAGSQFDRIVISDDAKWGLIVSSATGAFIDFSWNGKSYVPSNRVQTTSLANVRTLAAGTSVLLIGNADAYRTESKDSNGEWRVQAEQKPFSDLSRVMLLDDDDLVLESSSGIGLASTHDLFLMRNVPGGRKLAGVACLETNDWVFAIDDQARLRAHSRYTLSFADGGTGIELDAGTMIPDARLIAVSRCRYRPPYSGVE